MSKKDSQKPQFKLTKKGIFGFVASAAILAAVVPGHGSLKWLLIGAVSAVVALAVSAMSTPMDLTTHNREEQQKEREFEDIPSTGDVHADEVISRGKEMLAQIRAANDSIPDADLSAQIDQLEDKCVQVFRTVAEKPGKASQVRKFMNYYLPTTLKMLTSYHTMQERGVSPTALSEAKQTVTRGMGMVLTACQKQLDNLYKDTTLDVSTDIDVLEQMLKRDGFADGGLGRESVNAAARTAATAQLGDSAVPTLNTSGDAEDFPSFYQQSSSGSQK